MYYDLHSECYITKILLKWIYRLKKTCSIDPFIISSIVSMNSFDLEKWISEFHNRLYLHALFLTRDRADTEDLLQDAYENILKSKFRFNSNKGNFLPWAKSIIKNRFIDKSRKKQFDIVDVQLDSLDSNQQNFQENESRIQKFEKIQNFIKELKEPDKSIIQMKIYEKKTLDQTAYVLNLNRRTISRRYAQILLNLKSILDSDK